jgi:hypothetical protein
MLARASLASIILLSIILLVGCPPTQPATPNMGPSPSVGWSVTNTATNAYAIQRAPSAHYNIGTSGTYRIVFNASSPDGIAQMSWSGSGQSACFTGTPPNGQFAAWEPNQWPVASPTIAPPASPQALTYTFTIPCASTGSKGSGGYAGPATCPNFCTPFSTETVNASATNASHMMQTGTLTLSIGSANPDL